MNNQTTSIKIRRNTAKILNLVSGLRNCDLITSEEKTLIVNDISDSLKGKSELNNTKKFLAERLCDSKLFEELYTLLFN